MMLSPTVCFSQALLESGDDRSPGAVTMRWEHPFPQPSQPAASQ